LRLDSKTQEREIESGSLTPADAVRSSLRRSLELLQAIAHQQGLTITTPPGEEEALIRKEEAHRLETRRDPAVALAERYAAEALPIAEALRRTAPVQASAPLAHGAERIAELAISIASKTYRAVGGARDEDYDAADLQSDVHGSAKIARLMIAESLEAWRDFIKAGQSPPASAPARIVALLEELDAALQRRFPSAMQFVRPGFDA
jgi:hypothetical protein